MKTKLATIASIAALQMVAFSQSVPSAETADYLLHYLGIQPGSESIVTNSWILPETIQMGTTAIGVEGAESDSQKVGLFRDINSQEELGSFSIYFSSSERAAHLYWAKMETSRSLAPNRYFDSYVVSTNLFGRVCIQTRERNGSAFGMTNTCQACVLFQNAIVNASSMTLDPEMLAVALLRAGGVDIPEEPLRSSPPSSPPVQAMRVFSSGPEDASPSSSPPASAPVQAMRVFSSGPPEDSVSSEPESNGEDDLSVLEEVPGT